MIKQIESDIFEAPIDILAHQTNCMGVFGSGLARQVAIRFPEAEKNYRFYCEEYANELDYIFGTTYFCWLHKPKTRIKGIANIFGQKHTSRSERMTNYEMVFRGLEDLKKCIEEHHPEYVIGMPYRMSSDLGGADWGVIEAMIKSVFGNSPINVLICKRKED